MRAQLRDGIYAGTITFASRRLRRPAGQYDIANWRWRAQRTQELPGAIVRAILAEAEPHDAREDYAAGTREVDARAEELRRAQLHRAFDEAEVREAAESGARAAERMGSLAAREAWARDHALTPPPINPHLPAAIDTEGRFRRLACERWWRRQVRKAWTRASEDALRGLGFICRPRACYCSDQGAAHKAGQRRRMVSYLERHGLENECGEQLPLFEVAQRSIANPALRRAELMVRARGFEEIADRIGHVGLFVTLTAPSAFHARHVSGKPNERWERKRVREAQAWLCRQWARARAKFKRASVLLYGFRVAEPHHDGTPHWHLLLFCNPVNVRLVRRVLRGYWLAEFASEPGAARHRVKVKKIDAAAGTAAGYLAKYVAKNIDGHGTVSEEGDDDSGLPASDAAERVRAWASLHGIRQFQQVGGPPVGLYREARRAREDIADPDLRRCVAAADAGDWAAFIDAVGGISAGRKTNMKLHREETGECNAYLEPRPAQVVGLAYASTIEITRPHRWRIIPCYQLRALPSASLSESRSPCSPSHAASDWRTATGKSKSAPPSSPPKSAPGMRPSDGLSIPNCHPSSARPSLPRARPAPKSQTTAAPTSATPGGFIFARPQGARLGPVAITVRGDRAAASPEMASGAGNGSNIDARGGAGSPPQLTLAQLLAVPLTAPARAAPPRRTVQALIVRNAETGFVEPQWTYQ